MTDKKILTILPAKIVFIPSYVLCIIMFSISFSEEMVKMPETLPPEYANIMDRLSRGKYRLPYSHYMNVQYFLIGHQLYTCYPIPMPTKRSNAQHLVDY